MPRSGVVRWIAGCVVLLLGPMLAQAQERIEYPRPLPPAQSQAQEPAPPAQSPVPSCPLTCPESNCRVRSQPKVIVHMQQPEVVYDNVPSATVRPRLFGGCFQKYRQAPVAGTVSAASIMTPMSFTSGVVGQGFALNGLSLQAFSPQVSGFGVQSFGSQGTDLSDLRAAQELELHATHLATLQASREAEGRAYSASLQRIRTHLSSISPQGTKPETKTPEADSCCEQIKKDIQDLKTSIISLDAQIKDIKKVCEEIKAKK